MPVCRGQGLWLAWEYSGDKTLAYYLRHRRGMALLAEDLGVVAGSAVPTVMYGLLKSLSALHAAGVVHRDVKPLNMVLDERARSFKLIDLGAAADLRTGTNYVPDESILDPNFCAPELYVLPTDSMDLAEQVRARFPIPSSHLLDNSPSASAHTHTHTHTHTHKANTPSKSPSVYVCHIHIHKHGFSSHAAVHLN
jgi:serine/threonine protein kinase